MKIMNEQKRYGSNSVEVLNTFKGTKGVKVAKGLVVGAGVALSSTVASAAVTFDSSTQSFGGTFDLAPYYSAIGIVITAIAVVAAIRLAVGQFKRV